MFDNRLPDNNQNNNQNLKGIIIMKKLANTAKKIDVVAKVFFWLAAIGGAVFVVMCAVFACFSDNMLTQAHHSIELGPATFNISDSYKPDTGMVRALYASGGVLMAFIIGITCAAIHFVRKILEPMKNERPFDGNIHKNIRKLAWLVLFGGIAGSIMNVVGNAFMVSAYDFQTIFNSDAITGMEMNVVSDFSFIVIFALLFLLSYVFKYGEELQIQSDETL